MQSNVKSGRGDPEAQLVSNEKEWKELLTARVHQLESLLRKAQEECSFLRECYRQLEQDFQFNLAILDERDKELETYEMETARALTEKRNRQEELVQLHMQITSLEEQRARETKERQEELSKSQHNAGQYKLQLDELKCSMAREIQKQTEEHERMKWNWQCRIQEMEEKLTLQRQEMTAAFDSDLKWQQHEFNMKMDEMRAVVLSYDLKTKLHSKEAKVHCHAHLQATEDLKASKEFCQEILTQLQQKEQELKDLTAVKDYKINKLEDKLKWMKTKLKTEEDNHMKKYEDVIQVRRECEAQLEAQCQAHTEKLQRAEKHISELQEKLEALAAQTRCLQEDQQKAIEQKDETIQRYKQQLSASLKRERALEQLRVQVELEWQRCCEDMKAEHYLANEQLIQDLTQGKEQAKAELKEKEQELQDVTVLLRSVNMESHQAIQGLTPKVDPMASEEIHFLREQNSILQTVVNQMRKDMEGLSHLLPNPPGQPQALYTQPMVTEQPAQSTDICISVSSAGGLCPEKPADISSSMEQEIRVAEIKEQSTQLQEKKPFLQQQASGLMSGAKSNPPLLHTRLKKAALCILRLSREKQELIEMGNCLRGQITTAGVKETVPSTETQHDKHDRLSALEQLQYQLTTQELQHVLRQKACTMAELLTKTSKRGPTTKGPTNPWSKEQKTTPESSKNKEKTCLPSQSQSSLGVSPQPRSGLARSLYSSGESLQSLNKLWEKLDHGLSPSISSEGGCELGRREVADSGGPGNQMMVHDITPPIQSQSTAKFQSKRKPSTTQSNTTKTIRPGAPGRHIKIRNYNSKD